MMAVPPAMMSLLELKAGAAVELLAENGALVVRPRDATRYALVELLAQCDPDAPLTEEDRGLLDGGPAGAELI
jgi:antitoxin ChpS